MATDTARPPSPFSPLPHSSIRPDLPLEIFYLIRDHLRRERMMGTAAALMPISQSFYRLFSPIIDYTTLTLGANNVGKVLRRYHWVKPYNPKLKPRKSAPFLTPDKRELLDTCVNLTIEDLRSFKCLLKTAYIQERGVTFRKISHLSLGSDLVAHLGLLDDQPLLQQLGATVNAKHLCVTYPSPDSVAEFKQLLYERGRDMDDLWTEEEWRRQCARLWGFQWERGICNLIMNLADSWRIESITIHNLHDQVLPYAGSIMSLRVFYARSAQGSVAKDVGVCLKRSYELEYKRAQDMANIVEPVNTYDFVGSAAWRPGATNGDGLAVEVPTTCLGDIRDEMDEKGEDTEKGMMERFWDQGNFDLLREESEPDIHFVTLKVAVACECCGGK